jgi:hypothetical protein
MRRRANSGRAGQPASHRELARRIPKLELAVTLVLGMVAATLTSLQLGVVTWAVGILLTVNQLKIGQRLDAGLARVDKLADVVDLSDHCDVEGLRHLIEEYAKVPEREFAAPKEEVLAAAREELVRLRTEKSSAVLSTGAYYRWLLDMLDETKRPQRVYALSLMMSCEWDDSPVEFRFIEANIRAAQRGVKIDRIFVMPKAQLPFARQNRAVRSHFSDELPKGLRGHFVDADRLRVADRALYERLGDGFIAFDDRVALVDLHSTDGSARGRVTMRSATLREITRTFEELLVHSESLTPELLSGGPGSGSGSPVAPARRLAGRAAVRRVRPA